MQAVELMQNRLQELHDIVEATNHLNLTFRRMKVKYVQKTTRERMLGCLTIQEFGLPITAERLCYVLGFDPHDQNQRSNQLQSLHVLGDKHCLTMKRGTKEKTYEWVVHPLFLKYFYGEEDEPRENHRA